MKPIILTIQLIFILLVLGCKKNENQNVSSGTGVEFYFTQKNYSLSYTIDYSHINLDTIALVDTPFIHYNNIVFFDTSNYSLVLKTPIRSSVFIGNAGVHGNMFIVTLNDKKIYCGFLIPIISSIAPNWIFIPQPNETLIDTFQICKSYPSSVDPRMDSQVINRLKIDHKLK